MARIRKTINLNVLDKSSVDDAIKQVERFKTDLIVRTEQFTKRLSEYGVAFAQRNVESYDAIDTGALLDSIDAQAGDMMFSYQNGQFMYIIKTNCPWAGYVEFGTGIVGGLYGEHPLASKLGWLYDVNNHGIDGWFYFKNGAWHLTDGYVSRPFMLETYMDLAEPNLIRKVAREVYRE